MNFQIEFTPTAKDARLAQEVIPLPPPIAPEFFLSFSLLMSFGLQQSNSGPLILIVILSQMFSPRLSLWILGPIAAWMSPRNLTRLTLNDQGMCIEIPQLTDKKQRVRRWDWSDLGTHALLQESPSGFFLTGKRHNRLPDWQLFIPKRAFPSEELMREFRESFVLRLEKEQASSNPVLFELDRFQDQMSSPILSRFERWKWMGIRLLAIVVFGLSVSHLANQGETPLSGWQFFYCILNVAIAAALLIPPEKFWRNLLLKWSTPALETTLRVTPHQIQKASSPAGRCWRLFGYWEEFDINSFVRSGALHESGEGFLLEYPSAPGRIPSRSCWLPKLAFRSQDQIDAFRLFIHERIQGKPASVFIEEGLDQRELQVW